MRVLDVFCGAGGASRGYQLAGCHVTGVDINCQPHYCGDRFVRGDALAFILEHGNEYDFIHASPPCQHYSKFTPLAHRGNHPDLIAVTREALRSVGKPYVIENVAGARRELLNPVLLCGSMLGLPIFRHRYFEIWPNVMLLTPSCRHGFKPVLITDHGGPNANGQGKARKRTPVGVKREAAGIDWMTENEITEAIPPAFTQYLFGQLRELRVF